MPIRKSVQLDVLLFVLGFFAILSSAVLAAEESITVTTYYPSPYGVYSEMRLYPKLESQATACDDPNDEGLMFYDKTMHAMRVCRCINTSCIMTDDFTYSATNYWTLSGTSIYPNDPAWKVGIGTADITFGGQVSGNTRLAIKHSGTGEDTAFAIFASDNTERFALNILPGGGFRLYDGQGAVWNSGIVQTGGNVGIGTTAPSFKLDIAGGYQTSGLPAPSSVRNLRIASGGASPDAAQMVWGDNTGWKLHFGTRDVSGNFQSRVTFVDTGNVGIGTTNPDTKLVVMSNNVGGADRANQLVIKGLSNQNLKLNMGIHTEASPPFADIGFVEEAVAWRNIVLAKNGGNVGIGTPGPWANLHVRGNMNVEPTTTGNWQGLNAYNPNVGFWSHFPWGGDGWNYLSGNGTIFRHPSYGNTAWIRYDGSAYFAGPISTQGYSPYDNKGLGGGVHTWDVITQGGLYVYAGDTARVYFQNGGSGWMQGYLTQGSDIRDKKNIAPVAGALKRILTLRGIYFQWKDPQIATSRQMGLIAQDVEKVFPEVVSEGPDGKKAVAYANLTAALVEAVKELKMQNDVANKRIKAMEARIADLEKRRRIP